MTSDRTHEAMGQLSRDQLMMATALHSFLVIDRVRAYAIAYLCATSAEQVRAELTVVSPAKSRGTKKTTPKWLQDAGVSL